PSTACPTRNAAASPAQSPGVVAGRTHALLEFRELGGDLGLGRRLGETAPRERAVAVLQLEEREQDVLGADVVVPEPKRLPVRQLEGLAGIRVVRDEVRHGVD